MRRNVYIIEWEREALKIFESIQDKKLKGHIINILENVLSRDPLAGKPLTGHYKGSFAYRLGVIRILYKFYKNRLIIVIVDISHRRDVYRLR